ncbi:MAG: PH domain-containing protein [Euryarchaeota archaeon]|nr:PH domain-containing protein [Euryarchaeota archaeon]
MNYHFEVGSERITITRGVIGKRVANIPYERVQNVNIWRGVLDRIFGLYSIEIETAGASNVRGSGGYGTRMNAEGTIQGVINPQPIVEYIIAKSKGRSGLGDAFENKKELGNDEKMRLLEEKLIKGEISEKTYEELKRKYGTS